MSARMACGQEMCLNWPGDGCVCAVLDMEPVIVCERCGNHPCYCDEAERLLRTVFGVRS